MDKIYENPVAAALRKYFKDRGMTQQNVADTLGMTQSAISYILKGQRPISKQTATIWSHTFGFRIPWLLFGEGPMFNEPEDTSELPLVPIDTAEAESIVGGAAPQANYSIDKILEIMDRNSKTMLSQQQTIAELMTDLRKMQEHLKPML